jgi:Secretion system C-terminal sorting domain/Cleaved Adhesin Domain
MRKLTTRLLCFLSIFGALGVHHLQAQALHRGAPQAATDKIDGITDALPCGGTVLFEEDFENGIPVGWTVIDGDAFTPRPELLLQKGWQGRTDYRDTLNNKVVASPSWYVNPGKSNDWLITPVLTVGTNSCLSWKSYSQDNYFKEEYEVRIAATPDTAAFLATTAIFTVAAEPGIPHYNSVSLAAYAGQNVYVAFRQISDDKFVLCLDDVRLSNVNAIDIGVLDITYGTIDLGDTVRPRFQVANYGSDTVTSFQAYFSVDGGAPELMNITAVSLPPNLTVSFTHDSLYISDSIDANHSLCGWTSQPNAVADQDITNDTNCVVLTVGNPVSAADPNLAFASLSVFPNPFADQVQLQLAGLKRPESGTVRVCDLQGRMQLVQNVRLENGAAISLDLAHLAAGMYVATVEEQGGKRLQVKLIKR